MLDGLARFKPRGAASRAAVDAGGFLVNGKPSLVKTKKVDLRPLIKETSDALVRAASAPPSRTPAAYRTCGIERRIVLLAAVRGVWVPFVLVRRSMFGDGQRAVSRDSL